MTKSKRKRMKLDLQKACDTFLNDMSRSVVCHIQLELPFNTDCTSVRKTINVRSKVENLQSKLFHAAKQSLDRKFGALYDKIYRGDILLEAYAKVKKNNGAPGVDKIDFFTIEEEIGIENFLFEIQTELKEETYKASPVRRKWITKSGKTEKRPLGIPIIKDRVIQMAAKLILEPIFETNFLEDSYGYRPNKSPSDAIRKIQRVINFRGQRAVIDADIKGYFENINHKLLMNLLQRRINDQRVLKLIQDWLKSGVIDNGEEFKGSNMGTPQGGVISPLLANIYLHSFDKMFQLSGINGTLVRYCDDFVILLKGNAKNVQSEIEKMLSRLGLELNHDKTKITNAEKGFDFLGIHFRLCESKRKTAKIRHYCRQWPSNESIIRIHTRVNEVIGRRYSLSLEELIPELNLVIRGWNNYLKRACYFKSKRYSKLNQFVRERIRNFIKRKYNDQSRSNRRLSHNLLIKLGLCQFG